MSTVNEIPTRPAPQRFLVTLAGVTYRMRITWCGPAACWMLDIADGNDVPIIFGIPLVTGANLLDQYGYIGLGFLLIVQSDDSVDAVPTFASLGSIGHLYAVTA